MTIDPMIKEDLAQVAKLATQLGYPSSPAEIESRFSQISGDPSYATYVAKSNAGQVLGWIQINAEPKSLLIDSRADVAALVVDETERNQGIGKALLKRAEQWAQASQIPIVRLRSNVKRSEAHRFYLREGYSLSKTACQFVKEL